MDLRVSTYWARGIALPLPERALAHSLCFGGVLEDVQVAFGRVVTDRGTLHSS